MLKPDSKPYRVCLVRPPLIRPAHHLTSLETFPPIHLAYLCAALRKKGYETSIIDGQASDQITPLTQRGQIVVGIPAEEIVAAIPADVNLIGVNCMYTYTWFYDREIIQKIRKRFPSTPIVVGGEHATACPREIMESCPEVLAVFLGESDWTLLQATDLLAASREGALSEISAVGGIYFRNTRGEIKKSENTKVGESLDDLPLPDWRGVNLDHYFERGCGITQKQRRSMPIIATRGCPHSCHFCTVPNMWGSRWSSRPAKTVVEEMKYYFENWGVTHIDFLDLTLVVNKKWVHEFCDLLMLEKLPMTWAIPIGTRTEAMDRELINKMAKSGLTHILFSAESASPDTISSINKKLNTDHLAECMKASVDAGLVVKLVFINGFPEQRWKDVFYSWKYIVRAAWLGIHDVVSLGFVPYPGTEFYDRLKVAGLLPEGFDYIYLNNDVKGMHSWSSAISTRALRICTVFSMALFYLCQFTLRPHRFFPVAFRVVFGRPARTNIELILLSLFRTIQAHGRIYLTSLAQLVRSPARLS